MDSTGAGPRGLGARGYFEPFENCGQNHWLKIADLDDFLSEESDLAGDWKVHLDGYVQGYSMPRQLNIGFGRGADEELMTCKSSGLAVE
ncbi:hypothetical protein ColTof4_03101 [Colletotrichum tofieldiae]|nr:hypothetical protein ColTof3_13491 [Colletotrichum tofieldiae]GKT70678.1 hypothetical protein ColTof4_03101 [Colletotrichum tofieldiae]GKT94430.1 hypothetical protein Ct61P_12280 [Colletotrichum tofieldiae]